MKQTRLKITLANWRVQLGLSLFAVLVFVSGVLVVTLRSQATSPRLAARVAATDTACHTYVADTRPTVSISPPAKPATLVRTYPTSARNLGAWLLNFDPLAYPSAIEKLPSPTNVSACVMQGNWALPSNDGKGTNDAGYEVVMLAQTAPLLRCFGAHR